MSNKDNQSMDSDNYSEKAVFITIKDDASSPSVLVDQHLDNILVLLLLILQKNHSNSIIELENYRCDSPITMSYNGSRSDSYDGSDNDLEDEKNTRLSVSFFRECYVHTKSCESS